MSETGELKGLRGWLILVGIGVVFSPLRLLMTYVPLYTGILNDGTWEVLTSPGSSAYNPFWGPLLVGEMAYNGVMVVLSIVLIYLFFSKHYLFPKVYIALVAVSLVFIPLDAWLVTRILPGEPMFDPQTTKEFVRTVLAALIWVPYMLMSKRVKATFVERLPASRAQSNAGCAG